MKDFEGLHPDVVKVLEEQGIQPEACNTRYSDVYVDCESYEQAIAIKNGGMWSAMSTVFRSNIEPHPPCVEISLAFLEGAMAQDKPHLVNQG